MKKSHLFSGLILATAAMMLGSCKMNNSVGFQIATRYDFAVQTPSETGTTFSPAIGFATTRQFTEAGIIHNSTNLYGKDFFDYWHVLPVTDNAVGNITDLNGTYILKATDEKGREISNSLEFSFNANDALDLGEGVNDLAVADFTFSSGKLTATIDKVGGATHYMFFVIPVMDGVQNGERVKYLLQYGILGRTTPTAETAGDKITITDNISYRAADYWIYPAVSKEMLNDNSIVLFGKGKLLEKDADAFAAAL